MAQAINTAPNPNNATSFNTLYQHLQSFDSSPHPPTKPIDATLRSIIAGLSVHPALEAALHLLNRDLDSAHFLCRHMQAAPAHEGMYLHGILHRLEGDYDNARAWYRDVRESKVFRAVWGEKRLDDGLALIDDVEEWVSKHGKQDQSQQTVSDDEANGERALGERSRNEICRVVDFCVDKFGTAPVKDARSSWAQPEDPERKKLAEDMIIGDKGHRKF